MRHLRLPPQAILPEDLRCDFEVLAALQQARAHDDLVAQHGLVVVDVRCTVGAVVAVDGVSCWDGGRGLVGLGWLCEVESRRGNGWEE